MLLTARRLWAFVSIALLAAGLAALAFRETIGLAIPAAGIGLGILGLVAILLTGRAGDSDEPETDDIRALSPGRRQELFRGTSLFLREMKYRYSIRLDTRDATVDRAFMAEVNTVKLGFIPAVITDNTNGRQGQGFVAFVHDGDRWRGPGLPCPDDPADAVKHAARCVSPLAKEDETHFEGTFS